MVCMRYFFSSILVLISTVLLAQNAGNTGSAYYYDTWRTDHNLPANDVRSILQTRDGYVWLATVKGLARFDGARFRLFNSQNVKPEISRDLIGHLAEGKDSTLWIGIDGGGLVSYKNGEFSANNIPSEFHDKSVIRLSADSKGRIWVAFAEGLFVIESGNFRRIDGIKGIVNDLAEDRFGNMLVAAAEAFQVVTAEGVRNVNVQLDDNQAIARIGVGSDGRILLTRDEVLFEIRDATKDYRWNAHKSQIRRRVTMIFEESPGVFLVSSFGGGVERYMGGRLTQIRGLGTFQGATLNARMMTRDREGGIWVATGGGALRLRHSFIWTIGKHENLPDNHVWAVYQAKDGSAWAGTELGGTVHLKNGKPAEVLHKTDGMPADRITALCEMADGTFWFGGHPGGLVRKSGNRFEDMSRFPGYKGGSVRSIYEDRRGRVWVGTTGGLHRFDGQSFAHYPRIATMGRPRVNFISEDLNGDIWICSGGIFRLHGDSVRMFKPAGPAGESPAWSMLVDSGRVWFGTYGSGLHVVEGDSVVSFEGYSKEFGPNILSILEDKSGNLWINAEHELQRIKKQDLLDAMQGRKPVLYPRVFGALDGLTDIEFNGTGLHSAAVAKDGSFLYASMNGIVVVKQTEAPTNTLVPPVYVERLIADGKDIPLSEPVELPSGTKRIDIEFTALSFESVPKVKFRCLLEGIDDKWQGMTSFSRSVSYANLRYGSYRFHVMAMNADGVRNETGATIAFTVLPFFYETPAFIVLVVILGVSVVVVGFRWRVAALHSRQVALEQTVDEKTSALRSEIEMRKETEEVLRTIQEDLEHRVGERTTELSLAVEDLRRSREQYQKIVETAQEGIWMTDAGDVTIFANPKMADILGSSVEKLLGTDITSFLDDAGRITLAATRKRHREGLAERFELDFIQKSGSRVSTVISATPLLGQQGDYQGSLAMIADVTAQKRTERERQRVEAELRQAQKMEAVGQLAGGVAHDFNNLLIPILGYAEMLQKELPSSGTSHRRVVTIMRAAEKAALLTRQLLSFGRKQVMESKTINLNRVITDLSPILQRTIREDIEIRYKLIDDLSNVKGDASQIDQIIINLLVNARDAMPNGGVVVIETDNVNAESQTTTLSAALPPGRYVSVIVTDTGVGIAPDVREHIFEPFFTTKEKGKGTGLGLATVYGVVKQHNGHIWVYSEPGIGTTFKIYFPAEAGVAAASNKPSAAKIESPRGSATIVVTEDEEMVRQFVRTILEENGYTVYAAPTVEACQAFFRDRGGSIDLLLTDLIMPTMNGRELYGELSKEFEGLKVIYMSGYSDEVISHRGILEEGVAFIQKPFTAEVLLKKVHEALVSG